jgi:hypothetical protein
MDERVRTTSSSRSAQLHSTWPLLGRDRTPRSRRFAKTQQLGWAQPQRGLADEARAGWARVREVLNSSVRGGYPASVSAIQRGQLPACCSDALASHRGSRPLHPSGIREQQW